MAQSTQFLTALRLLAVLARVRPAAMTSAALGRVLGSNPAFLRRILAKLGAAGITQAATGRGGGAALARGPKKITLWEIFCAVETPPVIAIGAIPDAADDAVGLAVRIEEIVAPVEAELTARLSDTTLKAFLKTLPRP